MSFCLSSIFSVTWNVSQSQLKHHYTNSETLQFTLEILFIAWNGFSYSIKGWLNGQPHRGPSGDCPRSLPVQSRLIWLQMQGWNIPLLGVLCWKRRLCSLWRKNPKKHYTEVGIIYIYFFTWRVVNATYMVLCNFLYYFGV